MVISKDTSWTKDQLEKIFSIVEQQPDGSYYCNMMRHPMYLKVIRDAVSYTPTVSLNKRTAPQELYEDTTRR